MTKSGENEHSKPDTTPGGTGDEGFISEEQLRAMTLPDLLGLLRDNEITLPDGIDPLSKAAVLDWLLQQFGVE